MPRCIIHHWIRADREIGMRWGVVLGWILSDFPDGYDAVVIDVPISLFAVLQDEMLAGGIGSNRHLNFSVLGAMGLNRHGSGHAVSINAKGRQAATTSVLNLLAISLQISCSHPEIIR